METKVTTFPAWFAGKADITGGTVVALVNNDAELIAHEAEVSPGKWKLFPGTKAGQAAANAYVGSKNPDAAATTPGNPVTGAANSLKNALGSASPLAPLFQASIWLRAVQVIIGLALIAVGLARITGAQNQVSQLVRARLP
jgi:hypothetical protein